MSIYERKYNTATTISFPVIAYSTSSFHNSLTTTMFTAGDARICRDYIGFTNTATTPTHCDGVMVVLSLTAAEMSAKHIVVHLVDQTAAKLWEDQAVIIETYGTTTAQFALDRDNAVVPASLSANQNVGIASVTSIGTTVQASLTANQAGVTVATVTQVTNQVVASLTANQAGVTIANVTSVATATDLGAAALTKTYQGALSACTLALTNVQATSTAFARLDKNVSSMSSFDPSITTVKASLTAAQTGVTIADVTRVASVTSVQTVNSTVQASLTANQAGVTVATVTNVTGQVQASLTANQAGVTVATVTNVTSQVATKADYLTLYNGAVDGFGGTTFRISMGVPAEVATNDYYNGALAFVVTNSPLTARTYRITDYDGAGKIVTVDRALEGGIAGYGSCVIFAANTADLLTIKAKTDNLPDGITKNAALNNFEFVMVDSADHASGKAGLAVTAQRSIDGGAFGACANAVAEVGSGVYKINLAAADLNGDIVTLKFSAAGADTTLLTIKTEA